jgi:hypothetical protein
MAWPLSQDYNEAIQDPSLCFADPDLRAGQVVTNAIGLPAPRSGSFADVYEIRAVTDARAWAVKCFTRAVAGQRERYASVSAYLAQARLRFMVDFQYLEQGIRVGGQWYPVLKMDWVDGFLLNDFVHQHLDRPAMLEALGDLWLRMARRLRGAGMAHGDLQHGNVLLVPGRDEKHLGVKLIDYDGMFVPTLAGVPSGEVGHPAYQHPQRLREGIYSEEVDRFPLLLTYTAIRALIVTGRALWDRYENGDNLLFQKQDLEAPTHSPLFAELLKLDDSQVRRLAEKLIDAVRQPLDQTPLLDELMPMDMRIADEPWWKAALAEGVADGVAPRSSLEVDSTAECEITTQDSARERTAPRRARGSVWSVFATAIGLGAIAVAGTALTVAMLISGDGTKKPATESVQTTRSPTAAERRLRSADNNANAPAPRIIQHKVRKWDGSEDNYARYDNRVFDLGIGPESRGIGCADAGVEIEHARELTVAVDGSESYHYQDDNSFAGFFVDYHTGAGYTTRVALGTGMSSRKRSTNTPIWGKSAAPDRFVDLGNRKHYELDLTEWAPAGWDGMIWFTVSIQNTGRDTRLKAWLSIVKDEEARQQQP